MEKIELTEEEKKLIAEGVFEIVKFAEKNNVRVVIVAGSSAQPVAWLFRHFWRELFPKKPMPTFYALGTMPSAYLLSPEKIAKKLAHLFPSLKHKKGQNALILEEFISTGKTVENIKKSLQKLEFKNILTAALFATERGKKRADFVAHVFGRAPFFHGVRKRHLMRALTLRRFGGKEYKDHIRHHRRKIDELRKEIREISQRHFRHKKK